MNTTQEVETVAESPVDKVIASIAVAMHDWADQQQENLVNDIHKRLNEQRDAVLMKLMGFIKPSWGGTWEIDHCNGRNGQSVVGDFYKDLQHEAIKEWLKEIPLPTMSPAFKEAIAKDLQSTYEREVRSNVFKMARQYADESLNDVITEVLTPKRLEMYMKAQALINPPISSTTP